MSGTERRVVTPTRRIQAIQFLNDQFFGIIGFKIDPSFDKFRADPRFDRLLHRFGFIK